MTYIQGRTGPWEVVIGLEIHAQVSSKSKLFSGAATDFGSDPNTQVSLVDSAFPGMLPVVNSYCVEQAIKTGLGFHGHINLRSVFDRKNYFYADLPQGYQISQFYHPIVGEGYLDIQMEDGTEKRIEIERLHLEQDAGKSIHDQHPSKSHIDLNRSGVALMEIVTKPHMRSIEEAQAFLKKLRALVRCLGTCDGNMEQGSMRADVNISLRHPGDPLGTRAEIKNVNSIRFMGQAIAYEIQRQMDILEDGGQIIQETRLFDTSQGVTRSMRSKEDAQDYRYFPDPDLPPLVLNQEFVDRIRSSMPELPDDRRRRFISDLSLPPYDADLLTSEKAYGDYFEEALSQTSSSTEPIVAKLLSNWMIGELFAGLNRDGKTIELSPVSPLHLAQLISLIHQDVISGKIGKTVFTHMWETGRSPQEIIDEKGLRQVSDGKAIDLVIQKVLDQNQDKVIEYRQGKDKLFGFFVGQVMKEMAGQGNPTMINDRLKEMLHG
jgi:aspartyl-tRNA(Asn)/glutamyl-tRNA(Gln) amidotransferase subunit B